MYEITMPQPGQTMEEGTIIYWLKKEGDTVQEGEVLLEIETDKTTVEVESPYSGTLLKILSPEGETVPIHTRIAIVGDEGEDVSAALAADHEEVWTKGTAKESAAPQFPSSKTIDTTDASTPSASKGRVKASPAARKLARERGVDLSIISPGPSGRVETGDVIQSAVGASGLARRKMSPMRKAIARNLVYSKQNIPHFYIKSKVNAGPLVALRNEVREQYPCTLNDVIIFACARIIKEFPAFRCRLDKEEIMEIEDANIGIAIGVEDGLVVPVLLGADKMTLQDLAAASRRIIEKARSGKLEGLGKGVFTVSNLGMFGIDEFSAIINPPEAAILAVGAVREDAVVIDGEVQVGQVMLLTLSCDHRIIDGATASKFLAGLKELLEDPQIQHLA